MDKDEILSIYDDWYADTYDERFHGGDLWNDNLAAYKVELVGELLPEGGRWLDTGCGTGMHLSAFPDVERCGLDLSPSMLEKAAEANPAVPFVNGSYLDEHPEWVDHWDLVTNLWLSYQFVDSIKQIHQTVGNLASWVKPDGALLMHVADCEDVARGTQLPWEDPETPVFSDSLFITAVVWTWKESNGRIHRDLIAPQLQRMVNILAQFFEDVEVRRWPSTFPGSDRPKAVIGRRKRAVPLTPDEIGDNYPYTLTYPPPDHPREHGFGDEVASPGPDAAEGEPAVEEPTVEEPTIEEPVAEEPTASPPEPEPAAPDAPAEDTAGTGTEAAPAAVTARSMPTSVLVREVLRRSPGACRNTARRAVKRARGLVAQRR